MVGLTGADSLLRVARSFIHFPYRSGLYTISFRDGTRFREQLDGRVPYLELAAL
jgi:hypothetical protein